ncbi:hypothetical protein NMY22_g6451 [Coprinellus aureogranulatus]|nr:hypothetical protein NMY22_g6451 [Coprinellus aureogranulatus]
MSSSASASTNLKRACSSLALDNTCSACQQSFSAPQYLARHQKHDCANTKAELDVLRRQGQELRAVKRRRLDMGTTGNGCSTEGTPPEALDVSGVTMTVEQESNTQSDGAAWRDPGSSTSQHSQRAVSSSGHGTESSELCAPSNVPHCGKPSTQRNLDAPRHGTHPKRKPLGYHSSDLNAFRLKKRYYAQQLPLYDPDSALTSADKYDSTHHLRSDSDVEEEVGESNANSPKEGSTPTSRSRVPDAGSTGEKRNGSELKEDEQTTAPSIYQPFPNSSSFDLGEWFYGQGSQKSLKDFKALVEVLTSPDFSLDDIRDTKWTRVFQELGKNKEDINVKRAEWVDDAGWKTTDIEVDVPVHARVPQAPGRGVEKHVVGKLFHRSIVSIVEEKIRNAEDSRHFHYDGCELLWQPGPSESSPEFRIMSELYHSEAFLQAQKEVNDSPPAAIKDCQLPRVVVGLMFWSDATHVSTFSTCKIWPLYMLFANESKYRRSRGGVDLCNHVAYFDALSDDFKDYLLGRTGGRLPPNLMTYLNREVAHAQWEIILDDELLKAIVEGILIECRDGVLRRFFIRIFTYSTDYPERVLMATIKVAGDCPCVRCLIRKKDLIQMGTPQDMAFRESHPRVDSQDWRSSVAAAKAAINGGLAVGGKPVMALLSHSHVPNVNAFSKRLSTTGFDIFATLVVDLLHEFEIGVFKALFIHLIRVLDASGTGSPLVHELDRRFRVVPTFNKTIRKFSSNVSSLKRRAARDYEDILQCCIALLFLNARWHALAKLRMQSEATITLLEQVTTQLGDQYRKFVRDTNKINTVERPREAEKRAKASRKKKQQKDAADPSAAIASEPQTLLRAHSAPLVAPGPIGDSAAGPSRYPSASTLTPHYPSHRVPQAWEHFQGAFNPHEPQGHTIGTSWQVPDARHPAQPYREGQQQAHYVAGASYMGTGTPQHPDHYAHHLPHYSLSASHSIHVGVARGHALAPPQHSVYWQAPYHHYQPTQPVLQGFNQVQQGYWYSPTPFLPMNASLPMPGATSASSRPVLSGPDGIHGVGAPIASQPPRPLESGGRSSELSVGVTQGSSTPPEPDTSETTNKASTGSTGRRPKKLNICTVKFHALGHYPSVIRHFGPTDLYSTEWGEYFHKSPKAWTKQTSRKQLRMEISRHERRRKRLQRAKYRALSTGDSAKALQFREQRQAARNPDIHHFIGTSKRVFVALLDFSPGGRFSDDVLSRMFVRNLKQYLLRRFISATMPHLDSASLANLVQTQDWSRLVLKKDRLYSHQIMRIKYTTYDTRRDEDIVHLDTAQCNVMLLNPDYSYSASQSGHPFRYCRVMAILHAEVGYISDMPVHHGDSHFVYYPVELLWVRWYRVHEAPSQFRLDEAELMQPDEPGSHSFIDPLEVLRACHMIPRFCQGKRHSDGKGKSELAQDGSDWKRYYINRYVDRDMYMRYEWGLAVGHIYTHANSVAAMQKIIPARNKEVDQLPTDSTAQPERLVALGTPSCVPAPQAVPASRTEMNRPMEDVDTNGSRTEREMVGESGSPPEPGIVGGMGGFSGDEALAEHGENEEDEDEDEDENGWNDNSSIDTDDSRLRACFDEEEDRFATLFGEDY